MKRQNKLGTYLAVTAGVGCVTSASAATVVTFFDDENVSGLGTFGVSSRETANRYYFIDLVQDSPSAITDDGNGFLFRGDDTAGGSVRLNLGIYYYGFNASFFPGQDAYSDFYALAVGGSDNYLWLDLHGDDDLLDTVAQLSFDNVGGGSVIAIAEIEDGGELLFADGVNAINTASVPEPSGIALLALGSLGLATRRNRK